MWAAALSPPFSIRTSFVGREETASGAETPRPAETEQNIEYKGMNIWGGVAPDAVHIFQRERGLREGLGNGVF